MLYPDQPGDLLELALALLPRCKQGDLRKLLSTLILIFTVRGRLIDFGVRGYLADA